MKVDNRFWPAALVRLAALAGLLAIAGGTANFMAYAQGKAKPAASKSSATHLPNINFKELSFKKGCIDFLLKNHGPPAFRWR